jgi:hypothetical protein
VLPAEALLANNIPNVLADAAGVLSLSGGQVSAVNINNSE